MMTSRSRQDDARPDGGGRRCPPAGEPIPTFRRILVPLDGSPTAEHAVPHATAIRRGTGAELQLLRVLEAHVPLPDPTLEAVDWRLLRLEAEAYLEAIAARLRAQGLEVGTAVVEGKAADEIVRRVREQGVDLVVLSAYGHGGPCEFAAGSCVHKLLSLAPSSVLLVRPAAEGPPPAAPVAYRRILAAVDGSAVAEWALCHAAAVARAHGAELLVLHVERVAAPAWNGLPPNPEELELAERLSALRCRRARTYLERIEGMLGSPDLPVRGLLTTAERVEQGILAVAGEEAIDLIALSAHGQGAAPGARGAVPERLLARSPVPVLVFQDRPDPSRPDRR
jgi:nucleotide-binding universal stress UspA family protein